MIFSYFFPILFVAVWILVCYVTSRMGWRSLSEEYRYTNDFTGERIGLVSMSVNAGNYNNSVIVKYGPEGIYLKVVFLFRPYHPPIMIPWSEIRIARDKKILFFKVKELVIGEPCVALITVKERVYEKLESSTYLKIKY